ncbi:MAG: hypothetical protein EOP88_02730 [Verrucomicrobiaceae bacterium]|nr:MAG: hypothetical protein EOP88_02730 [Verrucomicrobiaceae bacterium]
MKKILPLIAVLAFSPAVEAQSLDTYGPGAAAVLQAIEKGGASLTTAQTENFLVFSTFTRAFLCGVEGGPLLIEGERKYGQPKPEEWMWNPVDSARSFLAFLKKHEPYGMDRNEVDTRKLHKLVLAWYLASHSGKTADDEAMSAALVKGVFKKTAATSRVEKDPPQADDSTPPARKPGQQDKPLEVMVRGRKIRLAMPAELVPLDGRLKELDDSMNKMAKSGNNTICALLGSPADSRLIDDGLMPALKWTVSIQQNDKQPPSATQENFDTLCDFSEKELKKMGTEYTEHFDRIAGAAGEAMADLTKMKATMEFGEIKSLGSFLRTDSAYCHTMVAHTKGETVDKKIDVMQVTSIAVMLVDTKVVSIYVSAIFDKPENVEWTRDICRRIVTGTAKLK